MADTSLTKTNELVYFGLLSNGIGTHWYYTTSVL